ncbi:hypothetical protein [Actinoplanes palleronii]|uniref:Uncharacterized protein n=1 Tax=Actinoplanes palleronii TaxID=113570 RepID=A0ABQ4BTF9_9ACTN|nr:hypothetical protein [Actinoplanes palleronii]GIE73974.1 hypothetical protein Apa02nite_100820 [Actinoplanes palleronii]
MTTVLLVHGAFADGSARNNVFGTAIGTADTYQRGESELFLAELLAADREHFTLGAHPERGDPVRVQPRRPHRARHA